MFYDLLHARCFRGYAIETNFQKRLNVGLKEFSYCPDLLSLDPVNLSYLAEVVSKKQSFNESNGFMEDAFLYYVPKKGENILVNFHPYLLTPKPETIAEHVDSRPHYINHLIIGDFTSFYTFEIFYDKSVWYFKENSYWYYYENSVNQPAEPLPARDIEPKEGLALSVIGAFIRDGREDAYKKTVAFLLKQYTVEVENRKFIIIKDSSAKNIEMWIAAIQCAFSPRIASCIPFATRMSDFKDINKINNQFSKTGFPVMIVGIDTNDKLANIENPTPISPFVLLDGLQKKAMFDADTTNPYFSMIVRFNDEQNDFCRKFLQFISIDEPNQNIFELFQIYQDICQSSHQNLQFFNGTLKRLDNYRILNNDIYINLFDHFNKSMESYIKDNFKTTLEICELFYKNVTIPEIKKKISDFISGNYIKLIYQKNDLDAKKVRWSYLKDTNLKPNICSIIANSKTINNNLQNLKTLSPDEFALFMSIYQYSTQQSDPDNDTLNKIKDCGIYSCYTHNDTGYLTQLLDYFSKSIDKDKKTILLSQTKESDKKFVGFIYSYLISSDNSIVANNSEMLEFCKQLSDNGCETMIPTVLTKRIKLLKDNMEKELFLEDLGRASFIEQNAIEESFVSLITILFSTKMIDTFCSFLNKRNLPHLTVKVLEKEVEKYTKMAACRKYLDTLQNREIVTKEVLAGLVRKMIATISYDNSLVSFVEKLKEIRMECMVNELLLGCSKEIKASDISPFLKDLKTLEISDENTLIKIYEQIDKGLYNLSDSSSIEIAKLIQQQKPQKAMCKRSAHCYALNFLLNTSKSADPMAELQSLYEQGVPSITDNYLGIFISRILDKNLPIDVEKSLLSQMFRQDNRIFYTQYIIELLKNHSAITMGKWEALITFAVTSENQQVKPKTSHFIEDAIIELIQEKSPEKFLDILRKELKSDNCRNYFGIIENIVRSNRLFPKPKSLIDKIFSKKKS